ncbi:flavin reductase family protein [Phaeobacter sp. PT47_59]|uniref:flavin reductase family protein n=1 Tax=Phaeobacter sp. PT47_59 TaxID=3029979 RepID=UPI0023807BEE|nr:flavin reductase family protein [Phaeobacter sp. PT47_59]MDE4172769.1 flavin reductase family protein [Phaeobacter sp. PT47_59]
MPDTTLTPGFTPGPETQRAYRDALGCFATGVTVITTGTEQGPLAFTANSFSSVSMDPPLLMWCPAHASLRHDAFVAAERFSIHVMAEDQLDLAIHFARCGDDFTSVRWQQAEDGTPHLAGVLARFDCSAHASHPAGDHTIILGQVQRFATRPGKGLIFKQGLYGGFLEQS